MFITNEMEYANMHNIIIYNYADCFKVKNAIIWCSWGRQIGEYMLIVRCQLLLWSGRIHSNESKGHEKEYPINSTIQYMEN